MFRSHVSDGELLALKHGAQPLCAKLRAHGHLKICGECRKRQDALEFLARNWLDRLDRDLEALSIEVEDARERFLLRVSRPVSGLAPVKPLRLTLTGVAMCAAVAAGVGVWSTVRNSSVMPLPVAPSHAIAKAPARPEPKAIETQQPNPPKKPARPIVHSASPPPILETELAILWILHREGICLRGSVEVSRASSTGLLVQGVLESPEERSAIESQVRLAAAGAPVQIDLHVAGEMSSATVPAVSEPATTVVASRRLLPGEELVRAYLVSQKTPPERLEAEVNRMAIQSVRISGDLWAQSWALRRLEEQFSGEYLAPFSRNQLNRMIADHLAALTSKLEEIRSLLGGAIGTATSSMMEEGDSSDGLQEVSKFAASVQDCFAGSADRGIGVSECRSKLHNLLIESSATIQHRRARAELAVIH